MVWNIARPSLVSKQKRHSQFSLAQSRRVLTAKHCRQFHTAYTEQDALTAECSRTVLQRGCSADRCPSSNLYSVVGCVHPASGRLTWEVVPRPAGCLFSGAVMVKLVEAPGGSMSVTGYMPAGTACPRAVFPVGRQSAGALCDLNSLPGIYSSELDVFA